jgi:hypothetical protein
MWHSKVAWALDRDDAAPAIYTALAPFAEELATTSTLVVASMGSVSRYLGQMAALMRDWPRVEVDFARAVRRNMETRARGEVAETRFDWASALLRHGLARDRDRASAMLEGAARGATELGMEPLRRRAADARCNPGRVLTAASSRSRPCGRYLQQGGGGPVAVVGPDRREPPAQCDEQAGFGQPCPGGGLVHPNTLERSERHELTTAVGLVPLP